MKSPRTVDNSLPYFYVLVASDCRRISKGYRMEEAVQPAATAIPIFIPMEVGRIDCKSWRAL